MPFFKRILSWIESLPPISLNDHTKEWERATKEANAIRDMLKKSEKKAKKKS